MDFVKRNPLKGKNGKLFATVMRHRDANTYHKVLGLYGTNELMLSDHTAIIDVTTIQGDIYISRGHTYTY